MRFAMLMVMILGCLLGRVRAADIVAGPMIGHVTDNSARIWMQLSVAKQVTISCYESSRGGREVSRVTVDVEGPTPFVCDTPLNNLAANKSYRIEVKLDGEAADIPGSAAVVRTAPMAGEDATFSVGFGSGVNARGRGPASIIKAIEAAAPRAFFFLGDTCYLPEKIEQYPTQRRAAFRFIAEQYARARREPDLQTLMRTTPCYAVWGAHDFAPAADFVFARETQAVFQHFWPNPSWGQLADPEAGTPDNPACYFKCSYGDVDFFMLDARMFRDDKTMLGDVQLQWLKRNLQKSRATFKIIGSSTPLLASYPGMPDTWAKFPEQAALLKWVSDQQISGILLVSGADRGYGELSTLKSGKYPLFELTTSVLAGPEALQIPENPHRVGQTVASNNFATLDFGGTGEHRFVTLRLHDAGKVVLEQTLFATQLH